MNKVLSIHLFLFLFTALFTFSGFSQALPDPGRDPIKLVDSIAQVRTLKENAENQRINIIVRDSISKELQNNNDSSSNILEKPKERLNNKAIDPHISL